MQIYEITYKPLKEGVLKGIADVVTTAATQAGFRYGASQTGVNLAPYFAKTDDDNVVCIKDTKGVNRCYTKSGENWYDNANKEVDPATAAMLNNQASQKSATRSKSTTPTTTAPTTAPTTTAPTTNVAPVTKPFTTPTPTAVPTGVQVAPGKRIRLKVPGTNAVYFKTADGWTNELGAKIQDANSISQLERYADSGLGREEKIIVPNAQPAAKKTVRQRKGKRRVR
jgi:hypothetical protein